MNRTKNATYEGDRGYLTADAGVNEEHTAVAVNARRMCSMEKAAVGKAACRRHNPARINEITRKREWNMM
jgi:hypothetical protein